LKIRDLFEEHEFPSQLNVNIDVRIELNSAILGDGSKTASNDSINCNWTKEKRKEEN
jgi:hypothetical protein